MVANCLLNGMILQVKAEPPDVFGLGVRLAPKTGGYHCHFGQ